jgi:hypothetical protein
MAKTPPGSSSGEPEPTPSEETAPLRGRTVVITRPREDAGELAAGVKRLGGNPLVFPTIRIRPVERGRLEESVGDLG